MSSNGQPKKYPKVSQIFTDEDGEKFEWVTYSDIAGELCSKPLGVLKPVKAEPKYIVGKPISMYEGGDYSFAITFPATEDQAQLIKEAVEALMGYIMHDFDKDNSFVDKALAARQSMKDES